MGGGQEISLGLQPVRHAETGEIEAGKEEGGQDEEGEGDDGSRLLRADQTRDEQGEAQVGDQEGGRQGQQGGPASPEGDTEADYPQIGEEPSIGQTDEQIGSQLANHDLPAADGRCQQTFQRTQFLLPRHRHGCAQGWHRQHNGHQTGQDAVDHPQAGVVAHTDP